jgi:hypothetical protein
MNILVRVELHGASYPGNYNTLHIAMERAGFTRSIVADNGRAYDLPTAEYTMYGASGVSQAFNLAKGAANSTGYNSTVVAVSFTAWQGF